MFKFFARIPARIGKRVYRAWTGNWHRQRRNTDMDVLWPMCLEEAPNIRAAREAFMLHCEHDAAWRELSTAELADFIDRLEPYE
jgi:hypothetical protein